MCRPAEARKPQFADARQGGHVCGFGSSPFQKLSEYLKMKGVFLELNNRYRNETDETAETLRDNEEYLVRSRSDEGRTVKGSNIPSYPGDDQRISSHVYRFDQKSEGGPLLSTRFNSWFLEVAPPASSPGQPSALGVVDRVCDG
jgi:hypothetical protein